MRKDKWEIVYYRKANGEKPVEEFLNELTEKEAAKVRRTINLLQDYGIFLREPHCKRIVDNIYELRTKLSNNIYRVLYFSYKDNKFVLTHGFKKKTQKTPPLEIERAKRYMNDYLKRVEKNKRS